MGIKTDRSPTTTATFAAPQEIVISHSDDSVRIGDGTDLVTTTTEGSKIGLDVNLINPEIALELDATDGDSVLVAGTEDGEVDGTVRIAVNNRRIQVLSAHDLEIDPTYADIGTKSERITQVDFTSATFSGVTVRKSISYTDLGNGRFALAGVTWSIV